jgi:hypothetical protein
MVSPSGISRVTGLDDYSYHLAADDHRVGRLKDAAPVPVAISVWHDAGGRGVTASPVIPRPEGVRLTGASRDHMMAVALTTTVFKPPFTLKTVAKTDSTNLRLYWHVGEIIFNWEVSVRRLKVHDPDTGRWWDAEDQGFLTVDQWHEIVWQIAPGSMRVLVDGQLRFERAGRWDDIAAPLAIGPCFGSAVTVRSFTVEQHAG